MSSSNPVAAAAPQTPPRARTLFGGSFTFASPSSEARTTSSMRRCLFGLSPSASDPAQTLSSPTYSAVTTFFGSPTLSSGSGAAAATDLASPDLGSSSSGSSAGLSPFMRRFNLASDSNEASARGAAAAQRADMSFPALSPAANASGSSVSSAAALLGLGSPRRRDDGLSSQASRPRLEFPRLDFITAPFLRNLKTNESTFNALAAIARQPQEMAAAGGAQAAHQEHQNFSIQFGEETILINAASYKKLGAGHFSNVYEATSLTDPTRKFVVRFFKETPGTGAPGFFSPSKIKPNIKAKNTLRYLGNQFIRYAKIQSNAFLAEHHVKFHTFDALIEKARNNPALLQEIQDLLSESPISEDNRVRFAMTYLTDGYITAEYVKTPCTQLNLETVSQISTLYQNLDVTLDPHLANWSQDGRMLDIYEDEHDAKHASDRLQKAVSKEQYEQFFARPAQLSAEHKKLTTWGELLYPPADVAAAGAAAAGAMADGSGPGSSAAAAETLGW